MGKGDERRVMMIDLRRYEDNWEWIFNKELKRRLEGKRRMGKNERGRKGEYR